MLPIIVLQGLFYFFATGVFSKLTDMREHSHPHRALAYAVVYGIIAGILLMHSSESATLALAIMIGVLLAGKIDSRAHQFALAVTLLTVAVLGFVQPFVMPLVFLVVFAFLDEKWNDSRFDGNKLLSFVAAHRLLLAFATLVLAVAGHPYYILGVIAFDLGYRLPAFLPKSTVLSKRKH